MARIAVAYDAAFGAGAARWLPRRTNPDISDRNDAHDVAEALEGAGHEVSLLALDRHAPATLARAVRRRRLDLVFNLCDLLEDSSRLAVLVPAVLDSLGVPWAGPTASGLAINKRKHDVKAVLVREGVPTPAYQVIETRGAVASFTLALTPPVILKPTGEHASVGIDTHAVCETTAQVKARARWLFRQLGEPVLVEELVGGREYFQSFVGDPARPLALMERSLESLPKNDWPIFTFEAKWAPPATTRSQRPGRRWRLPLRTPPGAWPKNVGTVDQVQALLRRAFLAAGGRDWGRVEFRVDESGLPMVIDVTACSYLGKTGQEATAARHSGLSYEELIARIAGDALARA